MPDHAVGLVLLCLCPCAPFQGIVWGVYSNADLPIGDACARCLKICRQVLCLDWQSTVERLAAKDATLCELWGEVESNMIEMEEWEQVNPSQPTLPHPIKTPTSISTQRGLSECFYWEVAFLTDSEILKWTGSTSKALGLTLEDRVCEDGISVVKGVYVSLRDLPHSMRIGDILSLKKVRYSIDRVLFQDEKLLERPVHKSQAAAVRQAATTALLSRRCAELQLQNIDKLPTLQSLVAKAKASEEVLKNQEQAGAEAADKKRSVSLALGSLEEDLPLAGAAKKRRDSAKPKQAGASKRPPGKEADAGGLPGGLGQLVPHRPQETRDTSPAAERAESMRSVKSKRAKSLSNFDAKTSGDVMTEGEIAKKLPGDLELQRVAIRLGRVPECFLSLSPVRLLAGEKIGRSVRAAMPSVKCVKVLGGTFTTTRSFRPVMHVSVSWDTCVSMPDI